MGVLFSDGPQSQITHFGKGWFSELCVLSQNERKDGKCVHRRQGGVLPMKELMQEMCRDVYNNFPKEEICFQLYIYIRIRELVAIQMLVDLVLSSPTQPGQ